MKILAATTMMTGQMGLMRKRRDDDKNESKQIDYAWMTRAFSIFYLTWSIGQFKFEICEWVTYWPTSLTHS